jgi:hypothetical protein
MAASSPAMIPQTAKVLPEPSAIEMLKAAPKVKIRVHETGDPNERKDVYVGVNGVGYMIRRGQNVDVPIPVAKVLEDSIQEVYEFDDEGRRMTSRNAQKYPFTYI